MALDDSSLFPINSHVESSSLWAAAFLRVWLISALCLWNLRLQIPVCQLMRSDGNMQISPLLLFADMEACTMICQTPLALRSFPPSTKLIGSIFIVSFLIFTLISAQWRVCVCVCVSAKAWKLHDACCYERLVKHQIALREFNATYPEPHVI